MYPVALTVVGLFTYMPLSPPAVEVLPGEMTCITPASALRMCADTYAPMQLTHDRADLSRASVPAIPTPGILELDVSSCISPVSHPVLHIRAGTVLDLNQDPFLYEKTPCRTPPGPLNITGAFGYVKTTR